MAFSAALRIQLHSQGLDRFGEDLQWRSSSPDLIDDFDAAFPDAVGVTFHQPMGRTAVSYLAFQLRARPDLYFACLYGSRAGFHPYKTGQPWTMFVSTEPPFSEGSDFLWSSDIIDPHYVTQFTITSLGEMYTRDFASVAKLPSAVKLNSVGCTLL